MVNQITIMQKLEDILNEQGYLICQFTGDKIFDIEDVIIFFIPINLKDNLIITVQKNLAEQYFRFAKNLYLKTKNVLLLENPELTL